MRKQAAAAVALVVLLGGCSSPQDSSANAPVASDAAPTVDPGDESGHHGDHWGGGESAGKARSGNQRAADDDHASEANSGGTSGDGGAGSHNAGGEDDGAATHHAAYPAGGAYVYSQKGSEAFCDPTEGCERYELPPTQKVATSYAGRTATEAMVITEVKASNGRYVRTTTRFTPKAAFVTEVYYRLDYEGFQIEEQYNPEPPVPQLRFPLREGDRWKASWEAETSGDYRARVVRIEQVKVGSQTIDAYRIDTVANFRGELDGKASVVMWFDAARRAIVRTSGVLDLRASYGSYNTTFETNLRSAPGY